LTLQIVFLNSPEKKDRNFWRIFLQLFIFVLAPIIWDKYVQIRRDLELFLLNKKNEKDRETFEEIIQLLPDSVVVVGEPPYTIQKPNVTSLNNCELRSEEDEENQSELNSFEVYIDQLQQLYTTR
jgi:hypothetical protein